MKLSTPLLALLVLAGCSETPPPVASANGSSDASSTLPANGAFVGRVWISNTPGRPLGSMIVFLPDRSLLMDSCFETYRLSEWGVADNGIRWREDSIPIQATVSMPSPDEMTLKIEGQESAQTFIAASVPYVCPDMPK